MTLIEAIKQIQERFASTRDGHSSIAHKHIMSGGEAIDHEMPALYLREEDAVAAWQRAMVLAMITARPDNNADLTHDLLWIEAPHTEWFRLTMEDMKGTFRLTRDYCTVSCRFAVEKVKIDA